MLSGFTVLVKGLVLPAPQSGCATVPPLQVLGEPLYQGALAARGAPQPAMANDETSAASQPITTCGSFVFPCLLTNQYPLPAPSPGVAGPAPGTTM